MLTGIAYKIYYIDHLVEGFMNHFNRYYADALATDFNSLPLTDQVDYVKLLYRVQSYLLPMKSQAFYHSDLFVPSILPQENVL